MKMITYVRLLTDFSRKLITDKIGIKYIPGFTLLEQILVLALTTILVLIGFTAILNMNRLMEKVRENASVDRSIYLLQQAMDHDFRNAEAVSWDGILRFEKTTGSVSYEMEDTFLVRISKQAIDTFRFVTSDLEIKAVKDRPDLVEHISFTLSSKQQAYTMSFFKEYPDFKIMERENDGN